MRFPAAYGGDDGLERKLRDIVEDPSAHLRAAQAPADYVEGLVIASGRMSASNSVSSR
jgi:hypothetical protein